MPKAKVLVLLPNGGISTHRIDVSDNPDENGFYGNAVIDNYGDVLTYPIRKVDGDYVAADRKIPPSELKKNIIN
ncbi:hypothetical protein [Rahnella bonaserana]|uniref:hypothetical protein n=1 Tax=Rahnella bonaserana TaxID=2816248 RepID=UPI00320ADE97